MNRYFLSSSASIFLTSLKGRVIELFKNMSSYATKWLESISKEIRDKIGTQHT